jgi:hypothetical protein
MGLGWILSNDGEIIWHNGGTGGFRSCLGFNPKLKRGIVVLSNSSDDWTDEFAFSLLDPSFKKPIIDKSLAAPSYLDQFVGTYEATLAPGLPPPAIQVLTLTIYGKFLLSALDGGEVGMIYPESPGVFGVKGFPDGKVYFTFDDNGRIAKIRATVKDATIWEAIPKKTN